MSLIEFVAWILLGKQIFRPHVGRGVVVLWAPQHVLICAEIGHGVVSKDKARPVELEQERLELLTAQGVRILAALEDLSECDGLTTLA